mmetsp:Transcript_16146/g.52784  ORF Transcript_16146/g.52784 Transcript_16146/m.52784 type:complete len:218 (+) Transcript_16146:830-1483(+)
MGRRTHNTGFCSWMVVASRGAAAAARCVRFVRCGPAMARAARALVGRARRRDGPPPPRARALARAPRPRARNARLRRRGCARRRLRRGGARPRPPRVRRGARRIPAGVDRVRDPPDPAGDERAAPARMDPASGPDERQALLPQHAHARAPHAAPGAQGAAAQARGGARGQGEGARGEAGAPRRPRAAPLRRRRQPRPPTLARPPTRQGCLPTLPQTQ